MKYSVGSAGNTRFMNMIGEYSGAVPKENNGTFYVYWRELKLVN